MRLLSSYFSVALLSLLLFANPSRANDELSPADRLIGLLDAVSTMQARFEQSSRTQEAQRGEIWLKKPNQFRLETQAPLSQTIVSDGHSLWTYDRDLEQVIISTLSNRVEELPILLLAGDAGELIDDYRVDFFEDEVQQFFLLQPLKAEGILGRLSITFEAGLPVSVGVDTATNERTNINLEIQEITNMPDDTFTFEVPDGIDVIDDRAE
ncbi:MAG: outer membrane lipoprotein chaperone LolA [Pseudomonadales bacterium]|nr:outer membrane lipoprotein chaperone LolA [Pseudomonadales bacterium]MBO6658803.1 outer membrane lipoprotein chaperone LolA [Pseudomonadales bacterium]MBO6701748.1 outer membrane lipoprotein chaperone LolA [Pseudomonadales bacterium]MBO7007273.1 outer membrane lipoprotein chaperone LolA [Pseudomonadales bacterium]